jgi:hypothetical protein
MPAQAPLAELLRIPLTGNVVPRNFPPYGHGQVVSAWSIAARSASSIVSAYILSTYSNGVTYRQS